MLPHDAVIDMLFMTEPKASEAMNAEALLRRGFTRRVQCDLYGALDDFRAAAEVDSTCAGAWNHCGTVRLALGDFAAALDDFDHALALAPRCAEVLSSRGRAQQMLGNFPAARADFDRALECATGAVVSQVLHNRAVLRQACGDLAGALVDLDQADALAPDRAVTLSRRAVVRKAAGDLAGARADVDRAVELTAPKEAAPLFHQRGGLLVLDNDFTRALDDYDRAVELEPENVFFHISRGNARYHLRDARGLLDYRTAFRINAESAAREIVRQVAEDVRGDAGRLLENCEKHLRINDRDVLAHARQGLALLLLGQEAKAASHFARCTEIVPVIADCVDLLIQFAKKMHDGQPAVGPG